MEFKGTKGEWYRMNAKQMGVPFIVASGNETLFQVYGDDAENNAKLITASPEMFEILTSVFRIQKDNYGNGMETHIALIQKANEIEQLLTKITQ